jgi:hypothetical protein
VIGNGRSSIGVGVVMVGLGNCKHIIEYIVIGNRRSSIAVGWLW